MRTIFFALILPLAVASCASLQPVPADPVTCPKPPAVAAWILEPELPLTLKLDKLFSISEPTPSGSGKSSTPASNP